MPKRNSEVPYSVAIADEAIDTARKAVELLEAGAKKRERVIRNLEQAALLIRDNGREETATVQRSTSMQIYKLILTAIGDLS